MTEHMPSRIPTTAEGRRREIRRLKRQMRIDRRAMAAIDTRIADLSRKRAAIIRELAEIAPGMQKQ